MLWNVIVNKGFSFRRTRLCTRFAKPKMKKDNT